MASKFSKQMSDRNVPYVVQCCPNPNSPWFPSDCTPFTLQKNHVYGYSKPDKIYFVLEGRSLLNPHSNTITIRYHAVKDGKKSWDNYRKIIRNSPFGKAILAQYFGPIEYKSADKMAHSLAPKRRKVRVPYLPMPNMRIPGGTFGDAIYVLGDRTRDYMNAVERHAYMLRKQAESMAQDVAQD